MDKELKITVVQIKRTILRGKRRQVICCFYADIDEHSISFTYKYPSELEAGGMIARGHSTNKQNKNIDFKTVFEKLEKWLQTDGNYKILESLRVQDKIILSNAEKILIRQHKDNLVVDNSAKHSSFRKFNRRNLRKINSCSK